MKRKYEVTLNDDERVILANMCRRLVIQLASSDAVLCPHCGYYYASDIMPCKKCGKFPNHKEGAPIDKDVIIREALELLDGCADLIDHEQFMNYGDIQFRTKVRKFVSEHQRMLQIDRVVEEAVSDGTEKSQAV